MAEKKEKKIIKATTESVEKTVKEAKPVGNAKGLRIGAVVLWVVAVLFEVLAVLVLAGKINLTFMPQLWQLIGFLVLDLACVIIGAQLWKKANHIDPVSKANPTKFWLWNNMGVIVCCFAFIPFLILMILNKDTDKKTKTICIIAAVIALLIGIGTSINYNPVSAEDKAAAVNTFGDAAVYWSPFGHVYHTHTDCQALNQTETLTEGTVEQAVAANRTRLCKFCANRDNITTVVTDD